LICFRAEVNGYGYESILGLVELRDRLEALRADGPGVVRVNRVNVVQPAGRTGVRNGDGEIVLEDVAYRRAGTDGERFCGREREEAVMRRKHAWIPETPAPTGAVV
jgi:hypothetical protein